MNQINCLFALWLCLTGFALGAPQPPRGVIIYCEPPATYRLAKEFAEFHKAAHWSKLMRTDGRIEEIPTTGLLGIINYPDSSFSATKADEALKLIEALLVKTTEREARMKLQAASNMWRNAMAAAKRTPTPPKSPGTPAPSQPTGETISFATTTGEKYENVQLTGKDDAGISIQTESGVQRIEFENLPPDLQRRFQFDAAKAAAFRKKRMSSPQQTVTSSGATGGKVQSTQAKQWAAVPVNADRFVEPGLTMPSEPPSYAETLEFINAKLAPHMSVGFGEKTRKMIVRFNYLNGAGYSAAFDPRDLNAEVRYERRTRNLITEIRNEGRVFLEVRNGERKITCYEPDADGRGNFKVRQVQTDTIIIGETGLIDDFTAEKLANAFVHLIRMFGGKKEAF